MRMGYLSLVIITAMVLLPLVALANNDLARQKTYTVDSLFNPSPLRPKVETALPALIWNPHHILSGDSINSSLVAAGYEAHLTDNLIPYIDSLNNFHLFIMAGIPQEYDDSLMEPLDYQPFQAAVDTFLEHGGSLFWEGIWSLTCAIDPRNCGENIPGDSLLEMYTKAVILGTPGVEFSYIKGVPNTYFDEIDSLGYVPGYTYPVVGLWRGGISMPLIAPQDDYPGRAAVCAYRNSHTISTNFSWAKLHDGYTNTRVQLITDVMNWLSSTEGVDDNKPDIPKEFSLSQNYPNPFNAQTNISYVLPKSSSVSIYIFDITGRKMETLQGEFQEAGEHQVVWIAADRASGIYFYRIKAGNYLDTKRMTLIK